MSRLAALTAVSAFAAVLVACASGDQRAPSTPAASAASPEVDPSASAPPSPSESAQPDDPPARSQPRILVTIGDEAFEMILDRSPASRDLIGQLPLTLPMRDHGSVEKIGRLPAPLSLEGQPPRADPDPTDVGYYAPSNDLVLYYGDQSSYPGIVILGRMDQRAAERIGAITDDFTATVTLLDP